MRAKPWQLALIALGLLGGGALLAWQTMGSGDEDALLVKSVTMVDVSTGQIYRADTSKSGVVFPARSPEGGKRSLLPVSQEAGQWSVPRRYLEMLAQVEVENKLVDASTGAVKSPSADVREYVKPAR